MGILNVRTGFALEAQRAIPAEVDVLDALVVQIEIDHGAHADLAGHLVLVGQVRALLLDDLARLLDRLIEQVLQIHDVALAGGQGAALVGDHAEGDVLHALVPLVAHQIQDLEELLEVQVLLIGDDVKTLVKVIFVVAIERSGQIAGDVKRRAVAAQHQRRGHVVIVEIDHLRALAFHQQALFLELGHDRIHLVVVESLAVVAVELDAQQIVHALGILKSHGLEPGEDLEGFLVAVLNLLEPGAAQIVQSRILLRLGVELHVQIDHRLHTALFDLFAVAPELVSGDHLAELAAPVAQVVDAHGLVAVKVIDALKAMADHRRGEMADVEALGDVDGGVVQTHGLALAHLGRAPRAGLGQHGFDDARGHVGAADEDVHIAAHNLDVIDLFAAHLFGQRGRDHRRGLAQGLGQAEARQRIVAQLLIRRSLEHRGYVLRLKRTVFKARRSSLSNARGDQLFHIHKKGSPFIPDYHSNPKYTVYSNR